MIEKPVCIGVLMGIPGSGKTYFCKFLQDHFANYNDSVLKNVYVVCVCYDEFLNHENIPSSSKKWKDQRKRVLVNVENCVCALRGLGSIDNCTIITKTDTENLIKSEYILLLIDDNMYYRSMRYQYYQLAKRHSVSFCQFYLKTDLKNALKFNKMRDLCCVIPEKTVQNMLEKFEVPNAKNSWERLSLTINSHEDFSASSVIMSIHNIIIESLNNPIDCSIKNNDEEIKSRESTNSNITHQFDIIMRRWIEKCIKEMVIQGAQSDELRLCGQNYCNRKKQILYALKVGTLTLPFQVTSFIENRTENYDEVYKYIEMVFS